MNYGKAVVKNSPLLFLNSGDFFMNKTTIFNINKFILRTKLSYVLLFGTQLKYDNIFFKISLNFFKDKKHVPHSSFIYINNYFNKKIDFNVKNTISADGDWMKSIIKRSRFILKIYKDITVHTLGGISTKPTISTVYYQFNYKIFEGIKELIKLILIFFMRSKLYYKFIYNRKYTHYEKN